LDPLHISGIVEARNFKFGMNIDHPKPLTKNTKLGQLKGSGKGHVTYFGNIETPSISGTCEATNLARI